MISFVMVLRLISFLCFQTNMQGIQPTVNMSRMAVCKESPPDGAHCLCFLSCSRSLVTVTSNSLLQILSITADDTLTVDHTFSQLSGKY